jgi:hypothetical protein
MFAGDVTVTTDPLTGHLRVVGDSADNAIEIDCPGTVDTNVTFSGRNGTTINGRASVRFEEQFAIEVRMQGGADDVRISNSYILSRVGIDLGEGDDVFRTANTRYTVFDILGGDGDDRISLGGVTGTLQMRILPGAGSDRTGLSAVSARKGLTLSDSGAASRISVLNTTVRGHAYIGTSSSRDRIEIAGSFFDSLSIYVRGGSDIVRLTDSTATTERIELGDGDNDFIRA